MPSIGEHGGGHEMQGLNLTPQERIQDKDAQYAWRTELGRGFSSIEEFVTSPDYAKNMQTHFDNKNKVQAKQKEGMWNLKLGGVLTGIAIGLLKGVAGFLAGVSMVTPLGWGLLFVGLGAMAYGAFQARSKGHNADPVSVGKMLMVAAASIFAGSFLVSLAGGVGAMSTTNPSLKEIGNVVLKALQKTGNMFLKQFVAFGEGIHSTYKTLTTAKFYENHIGELAAIGFCGLLALSGFMGKGHSRYAGGS